MADKGDKSDDDPGGDIFDSGDVSGGSNDSSSGSDDSGSSSESSSGSSDDSSSSSSGDSADAMSSSDPKTIIKEFCDAMAAEGKPIAPGDDPLEVLKHAITALKTHQATKEMVANDKPKPETGAPGGTDGSQQEARPYLMSLAAEGINLATVLTTDAKIEPDPQRRMFLSTVQGFVRHDQKKTRLEIDKQIAKLEKRGAPANKVRDWRNRAGAMQLSLTEDGNYIPTRLQIELDAWTESQKHNRDASKLLSGAYLNGADEVPRPGSDPGQTAKQNKDDQDYMIRMAGLNPAARADKNGK